MSNHVFKYMNLEVFFSILILLNISFPEHNHMYVHLKDFVVISFESINDVFLIRILCQTINFHWLNICTVVIHLILVICDLYNVSAYYFTF